MAPRPKAPLYEPSSWMLKAVRQRLRDPDVQSARQVAGRTVLLLKPDSGDRDCDRCFKSVPPGQEYCLTFLPIELDPAFTLGLVVGLCEQHARLEFPTGLESGRLLKLQPVVFS